MRQTANVQEALMTAIREACIFKWSHMVSIMLYQHEWCHQKYLTKK